MLKTVILAENALDADTWETFEVENVREFLHSRFDKLPDTAKIYHNQVAESNEITFHDDPEGEKLAAMQGTFYVIVYPGEPIEIALYVIYAVVAIASYYYAKSQIPSSAARNVQNQSPNNELSERTNKARPRARIPDIYGTVRSTPDLLSLHTAYVDNTETEYMYTCVSRGACEIQEAEVKDETTPYTEIEGSSVEIYAPNTSPNSGDSPQLTIGDPITEPIYIADRSNAVNGQVLEPIDVAFIGNDNISLHISSGPSFPGSGVFMLREWVDYGSQGSRLSEYFSDGDTVELLNAQRDYSDESSAWATATVYALRELVLEGGTYYRCIIAHTSGTFATDLAAAKWEVFQITIDLDGAYTVLGTSLYYPGGHYIYNYVYLDDPTSVTADWNAVAKSPDGTTGYISPTLTRGTIQWTGPFLVKADSLESVYANFVALNGLYGDNGSYQFKIDVELELELTPTDSAGIATGDIETFDITVEGSGVLKSTRAKTLKATFGTATAGYEGYFKARARRITPKITTTGNIMDEIKWRDLYAMGEVTKNDFGDITTVHSVTQATGGALVAKSRKLNMLATRKLPRRISGSTFTTELYATDRADEIMSAMCLDPRIGNRSAAEVDFDNIYDTVAEIEAYFGHEKAVEFGYTFDADNLSFEEMISTVVKAVYSTAYRFGSVIRSNFEKETDDSVLLFNHRNKLPGSEKRSVQFGNRSDFDGVQLEYVDPEDDAVLTIYLPDDTAQNPQKVETIGVRNRLQAYWLAWRLWNKIQLQNVSAEFDATQEADLLVLNDRILVADNTRTGTQDGEVISQNGLELQLSQPTTFEDGSTYTIFLQHTDGTTESLVVTAGSDSYHVILGSAPKAVLSLDSANYARATYQIVDDSSTREQAFLVTEKDVINNFASRVTAINYDAGYYTRDSWYKDGIINEEGEPNEAGDLTFSPDAGSFILSEFPVSVTITEGGVAGVGHTIRYSKTSMPALVTEGTEYTAPVDMADGETLYARAFTPIDTGDGLSGSYDSVPNLDFQFETNSQYLATM